MKIKILPAALALVLTSALLFGGWYGYKSIAVEKPFEKIVNELDGIKSATPVIESDRVTVELQLEEGAAIRDIYQRISTDGSFVIGNRELVLDIQEKPNEKLDTLWYSMLFEVAQAMETRQYSTIPEAMNRLEKQNKGLTVHTEMDEVNVYITMSDGEATKYIVLPRIPAKMGVWPNV